MAARVVGVAYGPETLDLDGRETLTALYARVADAFDDLVRSSDAAAVVVFTHDAVVRAAGGVDAAHRPGHLPVHRCGELLDYHDPRVHFWLEAGCLNDTSPCRAANDEPCRVRRDTDPTKKRSPSSPASRSLIGGAHPRTDTAADPPSHAAAGSLGARNRRNRCVSVIPDPGGDPIEVAQLDRSTS
ncbi:MAG TPA: histidine phosphatase family protein, partial [Propionibacteriaceae bacterium]